jgi:hypothetical protein
VVADGGYSAKKVSQATPPKANLFGHGSMLRNDVWKSAVYVVSPLDVIAIGRIPQSREQSKLQVIVRIHEAGQEQESAEVDQWGFRFDAGQTGRGAQDTGDAVASDLNRGMRSLSRSEGASSTANVQLVLPLCIHVQALQNQCRSYSRWESRSDIK